MERTRLGITTRRFFPVHGVAVAVALAAFATSASAQPANIDLDEHRTTPVPHR